MKGVIRVWRVPAEESGAYVEVGETRDHAKVAVAVLRGDQVTRVWLSYDAWQALTELRYRGPDVKPLAGQDQEVAAEGSQP